MLTAIPRYGARVHPTAQQMIAACRERGEFIEGPHIRAFEQAFASRLGARHAAAVSCGRMGFYVIVRALQLPAGSEIVVPALTCWTVPELARVARLRVRFADVDPVTSCLDPASLERAITPRTRAVVPTHLYGLPCDMDAILDIAGRHNLAVIEDCAHALGASYRGRPVGTFGDGAFFSFQTWRPLSTSGGGMAVVRDGLVASRVREQVAALPWPHEKRTANKLFVGRLQRIFTGPRVFTLTGFPVLWLASLVRSCPDLYNWEQPRRLDPLPEEYLERYANVQAVLGMAALDLLDGWTAATRSHAHAMSVGLAGLPAAVEVAGRTHVYSRYCLHAPNPHAVARACIRRGVDVHTPVACVCPRLDLFEAERCETPGADRAAQAVQVPIHASLTDRQMRRVIRVVRNALSRPIGRT